MASLNEIFKKIFGKNKKNVSIKPKPLYKKKGNGFISVDFGERSLRFAVGNYSNNILKVDKLFSCELPNGAYNAGQIKDKEIVSSTILNALKENKVQNSNVIGIMESMDIIKRTMTIPVLSYEDSINFIKFEIGESLPIDISTYILHYNEIKQVVEEGTEKLETIVYVFPKELASTYYETFLKANLNPCVLDVYSNGIEKLLETQTINGRKISQEESISFITFDENTIIITIIKNGKYDFSRILYTPNNIFSALISKGLFSEQEASDFIKKYRTDSIFYDFLEGKEREMQKIAIETIDNSISEVNKIFEYWTSRSQENRLDHIIISGENMTLLDIDLYYEARTGVFTERINKIGDISGSVMKDGDDLAQYTNAISALIRRD